MKAVFELKEVSQSWERPTAPKKITVKEVEARSGEQFDTTERREPMFALLRAERGRALVEYNRAYTLKGYEQPLNRTVWFDQGQTIEFSSLWNDNGITKRLTLKRLDAEEEPEPAPEQPAPEDGEPGDEPQDEPEDPAPEEPGDGGDDEHSERL